MYTIEPNQAVIGVNNTIRSIFVQNEEFSARIEIDLETAEINGVSVYFKNSPSRKTAELVTM